MARVLASLALASVGCARPAQTAERIVATPVATPAATPALTPSPSTHAPVVRAEPPPAAAAANSAAPGPSGATCTASWYAAGLVAPEDLTAASRDYERGTHLRVSHAGRTVVVRVNDYGPQAWTGRCIDLSRGAFRALANPSVGLIDVHLEVA